MGGTSYDSADADETSDLKRKGKLAEGSKDSSDPEAEADSEEKGEITRTKAEDLKNNGSEHHDEKVSGKDSPTSALKPTSSESNESPTQSSSKYQHSEIDRDTPSKFIKLKENSDDGEGDEEDLEALKAIEAAKLENIPRSRTFLATVSSKLHRIEVRSALNYDGINAFL